MSGSKFFKRPGDTAAQLVLLLCLVYFTSYITRLDYSAVMVEITASEGIGKPEAALAVTSLFVTYGAGQLVSGWLGDRNPPKLLITGGLILSAAMNLAVSFGNTGKTMVFLWAVNGFAQALLWPPIVKLMTGFTSGDRYQTGITRINIAASAATIMLYLCSPAVILLSGWRGVFRIAALLAAAVSAVFYAAMSAIESGGVQSPSGKTFSPKPAAEAGSAAPGPGSPLPDNPGPLSPDRSAGVSAGIFSAGLVLLCLGIVSQGILRDGVTTWLPTYLSEVFSLPPENSILTSILLPVFSMLSLWICAAINRKVFRNEVVCSIVLFAAGGFLSLLLSLCFGGNVVLNALLASLLTACMHGVNLMLVCTLPARFAKTGKVSLISGIMNSCTYIGSAVSTYGFAAMTQARGWHFTVMSWIVICAAGALLLLAAVKTSLFSRLK